MPLTVSYCCGDVMVCLVIKKNLDRYSREGGNCNCKTVIDDQSSVDQLIITTRVHCPNVTDVH